MERKCSACGARISEGMKICANCGKVVPPMRTARPANPNAARSNVNRNTARPHGNYRSMPSHRSSIGNQRPVSRRQPENNYRKPEPNNRQQVKRKGNGRKAANDVKSRVFKALKIALIVLIIYVIISIIQIFRVRFATYDFKVDMKMSQDNYGQAIDNYFDSGHWVYNPFTFTVTYKGEKQREGDYELKFSAISSVKLKSVVVDGKAKDEDKIESAIMGLFI